jgi:hypothetical protein
MWLAAGCTLTIENDASAWGGNGDRWFTGGMRGQRDVVADAGPTWADGVAVDVAERLDLIPADVPDGHLSFTTVASVLAMEIYTPDDIESLTLVEDDRPYAGWAYTGVVRYDTHLDPDSTARRDVETEVELDVGLVGPIAQAEAFQDRLHYLFGGEAPDGWDNQLENEPGVILRGRHARREAYREGLGPGGLAWDVLSLVGGAVGNIDTHASAGGSMRVGFNLPRSFGVASGDRSRLLPGRARSEDEPASLYVHVDVEGRLVLRNLFLDGNTFRDSHSIDKDELVGSLRAGVSWEWGAWRLGYAWTRRGEEFEGQDESQTFGAYILSWTPGR